MNQEIDNLNASFMAYTDELRAIQKPGEKLIAISAKVDETLIAFNKLMTAQESVAQQDEIRFFKEVRPGILAVRIEEYFRYNLDMNAPVGTGAEQQKYYEDQSKSLQCFFLLNTSSYQYYKNGSTELDTAYFLRGSNTSLIPVTEIPEPDIALSTSMSGLFARFMAYERVHALIQERINSIKNPHYRNKPGNESSDELRWTGDIVNLVELAYGIWLTGQVNHGNASLNQIVRWLEGNLGVSIGIIQRRFTEIASRKRLSITRYIDQMKDAITKKIEQGFS